MPSSSLLISDHEHRDRISKIRAVMRRRNLDALYLTSPTRILYTTGFAHITTERPLAVVIPTEGPIFLMGPHLEKDHVKQETRIIEEMLEYSDYPGKLHPIRQFAKILGSKRLANARIASDSFEGAAGGWSYRGPSLRELLHDAKFFDGRDIIDEMRIIKSREELRLLRESAKWSQVAHDILMENTSAGLRDVLIGLKASNEALQRLLGKLGAKYKQLKWGLSPVVVGFRGQVGPDSAIPHAVFTNRKIRKGDVLVTEAGVEVGGYTSELERTIIVGKPSTRTRKHFDAMFRAQAAALKTFKPGNRCDQVDDAARKTIEAEGFVKGLRHHTGHGIGLDAHEPPWLDPGDRRVMRRGMVFSCEPGIYVPGYAGFRHSDTIEVTSSGMEFITNYPRELEELTV